MPKKYEPLSKQEKEAIIKRNKEIVNEMNTFLKQAREEPVKEFDSKKLDDPSFVSSYRIAEEMKEIKSRQEDMLHFMLDESDYHSPADKKWLVHLIKTENNQEDTLYNQQLIKDYKNNPDKLKAHFFKKVTSFNPVKLVNLKDDKSKMLEFYHENHEIIDLANVLSDPKNEDIYADQNEAFKKGIKEMSEPLSVIGYPAKVAKDALDTDFYAMPELSKDQAHWVVVKADNANKEFAPYVRDTLEEMEGDDITRRPGQYFNKIKDVCHIKLNNEFVSRWHAVDHTDDGDEIADFTDVLKDRDDNTNSVQRNDGEYHQMRYVNSYYTDRYTKAWKDKFQQIRKDKKPFDVARIKDEHKGGWYERLRGTTSKEYKRFIQAFEDYNDPKSEHYLDKEHLSSRGNAYLRHKFKGKEMDLSKLSGTSLKRTKLVNDTLETLKQEKTIENDIDREISEGYQLGNESFLEASDVEELAPNKVMIKEHGVEQNIDVDIELEKIEL